MNTSIVRWLRHAESEANAGLKTSLPEEIALTLRGRDAAASFAAEMTSAPAMIVVSKFVRAVQTAEPILARFPDSRHISLPVHEFTYLSPARCQNTSFDERRAMVTEFWKRCDPSYIDGSGAESFLQFGARIRDSILTLARLPYEHILVVSHEQVMQLVRGAIDAGSFEAVSMSDFRKLVTTRPMANLQVMETRVACVADRLMVAQAPNSGA